MRGECGREHDPNPFEQYTMATGQVGWKGSLRFRPREGYCQDEACYNEQWDREDCCRPKEGYHSTPHKRCILR